MDSFKKFSWSRDKSDLMKGLSQRKALEKENYDVKELNKASVFTSKIFTDGFQMANLLQDEKVVDELNALEIDEKNLNHNLNNKDLIHDFLTTADKV